MDSYRQTALELLDNIFNDNTITSNLEKGIFNASIDISKSRCELASWSNDAFRDIYLHKFRKLFTNLDDESYVTNVSLRERIKNAKFPHEFAFFSNKDLNPLRWSQIIENKQNRDKTIAEIDLGSATTIYTCPRCKNNKCTYYEMQTRGSDEAMSTFITCLSCSKKWKKN